MYSSQSTGAFQEEFYIETTDLCGQSEVFSITRQEAFKLNPIYSQWNGIHLQLVALMSAVRAIQVESTLYSHSYAFHSYK